MRSKFFTLENVDGVGARAGLLDTEHGVIETPVFMPVGTYGAVKSLSSDDLKETRTQIILGNAYHLYLRPGIETIKKAGGLHEFMNWDGPILTDSGGFQVFSLPKLTKIDDEGVTFQDHIDGSTHRFTPSKVIDVERNIGADIIMNFDECAPYPSTLEYASEAEIRTANWAARCKEQFDATEPLYGYKQFLFGIVQGSTYKELREKSTEAITALDFDGYAIGGLAVGESPEKMYDICGFNASLLPENKPRYLMGVGKPEDLIECVALGIDMFDCVVPTRNGRKGTVYTNEGKLNLNNAVHKTDSSPIENGCSCESCQKYSRSYLRHLFKMGETLAGRAATIHNLHYYMNLMTGMRNAIMENKFGDFRKEFYQLRKSSSNLTVREEMVE
ncbi:MAG: tRNA guanosine(34) transglycosylase Tgt [Candidatus Marinimicrobia bacterium]|nr:tRNA guanosine(34) transglycosylase Tgt [Candidatus Neomarinimicrobiota bacterium]